MTRRPRQHHRAMTLAELLIALGILAIFGLVATQVFYSSFRVSRSNAAAQDAASSFDAAMSVLRSDAWTASELAAPDANTAKLGRITWTIKDDVMTRDAGDRSRPRTWPMAKGASFAADGATLMLRVPAGSGERGGEIRIVSEARLLERLTSS